MAKKELFAPGERRCSGCDAETRGYCPRTNELRRECKPAELPEFRRTLDYWPYEWAPAWCPRAGQTKEKP